MDPEITEGEDDALNPGEGSETIDPPDDAPGEGDGGSAPAEQEDEGEVVVTIGDEEAEDPLTIDAPDDSSVIKQLRTKVRESAPAIRAKERENKQLREELDRLKNANQPAAEIVVGAEPDPDDYEMWDADGKAKFKTDYTAWNERKTQAAAKEQQRRDAEQKQQAQWKKRIDDVDAASAAIKVPDLDAARESFEGTFSIVQRGMMIGGPEDAKESALLRYALGKTPAVAKKLAQIEDPVRFAFAAAKVLYKELNVKPRAAAPKPETVVRSSVSGAAAVDSELKRLEAEADKTGDRTKVAAHLRTKNKAKQAA